MISPPSPTPIRPGVFSFIGETMRCLNSIPRFNDLPVRLASSPPTKITPENSPGKLRQLSDNAERSGLNPYIVVAIEGVNVDFPHPYGRRRSDRKCLRTGLGESCIRQRRAAIDVLFVDHDVEGHVIAIGIDEVCRDRDR